MTSSGKHNDLFFVQIFKQNYNHFKDWHNFSILPLHTANPTISISKLDTDKIYHPKKGNMPTQNGKKNDRNKTHK